VRRGFPVSTNPVPAWIARLSAGEETLRSVAPRLEKVLTRADPATAERWTGAQVLAHVAELLPYWLGEAERMCKQPEDDPVGRTKKDGKRLDAVAAGRDRAVDDVLGEAFAALGEAKETLRALTPAELECTARHLVRGPMTAGELIETFVVEHLEEHVDQVLQALEDADG
jgi:DinB superfamily